jgi:hypothetical protein
MNMIKIYRYRNCIFAELILPLLFLFVDVSAFPKGGAEEIRVEKINQFLEDDAVVITYHLIAPLEKKYEVSLILRRANDRTFQFFPKTVSGDIGKGAFAGENREIRWLYKQDTPQEFNGEDYYFVIIVKKAGGGKTWLYGALGAATAIGVVWINKCKLFPSWCDEEKELPLPPSRP